MEAHVATLKEQLAASEARLEKQAADSTKRDARHTADLAAERARTEKAIAAFESLAQRIEAMPRPSDRGSRKGNDRAYDRPNEGPFIKAPGMAALARPRRLKHSLTYRNAPWGF